MSASKQAAKEALISEKEEEAKIPEAKPVELISKQDLTELHSLKAPAESLKSLFKAVFLIS